MPNFLRYIIERATSYMYLFPKNIALKREKN